jgi:hypothetical protein
VNVPTIEMPREAAIAAYREYRQAVRDNDNPEDRACMLGYRALAKGQAVIDLHLALRDAGLDDSHRPKLAIARADWSHVYWTASWNGGRNGFAATRQRAFHVATNASRGSVLGIPAGIFSREISKSKMGCTVVPAIPPRLRPNASLSRYHVLFEGAWQDVAHDPLLLRHLGGVMFAVLAVWDLTPVERAVLRRRPNPAQ